MLRKLLYQAFGVLGTREVNALEAASHAPLAAQQLRLFEILSANAGTEFGTRHGFSRITSISDFQRAVPINDYEALKPDIERMASGEKNILTAENPLMFATTSGTSGSRKLIPVTKSYMKEFRRASVASGFNLLKKFPGVTGGVTLSVVSPAEEGKTQGGIPYGAISGRLFKEEPALIKRFISPIPYEVFLIPDYETRYYALLRLALVLPIATIYTLNPSTILLLARKLKHYSEQLIEDVFQGTINAPAKLPQTCLDAIKSFLVPDPTRAVDLQALADRNELTPDKVWPQLSLICCWTKAAAGFYLQDFPEYFGNTPVVDITYGASEGRGTVCLAPEKQMLALRSHFFEFVPENEMESANPTVLAGGELEPGQNYHILFTTSGGLYRYNINDVVKVSGFHNKTPLLEFLHKGGNISSFTGEKITESQVSQAMSIACTQIGLKVRFFTVVPEFRPRPHYQIWTEIEGGQPGDLPARLSNEFDSALRRLNIEYDAKRESSRLDPVVVSLLSPGAYEALRRALVAEGVPDAQIKISHLNPKEDVKAKLAAGLKVPAGVAD